MGRFECPPLSACFKPAPVQTPEDGVYKMLDAARARDLQAYVDCFLGDMRQQVLQITKETSASQFSKYLVSQNATFTGVAVSVTQRLDSDNALVRGGVCIFEPQRGSGDLFAQRRQEMEDRESRRV